jgi:hypothetical protein
MPAPQQQVIYLPAARDTTGEGAAMLMHAISQVVQAIQADHANKQYLARQAQQDAIAAEERQRQHAAQDNATQRASEAELAKLAPETSMYETAPPVALPDVSAPGQEDLAAAMPPQTVDLGLKRLAKPLLTEITLPNGQKVPFNVRPAAEEAAAETAAAQAISFPADESVSPMFRGKTFHPGDAAYALAKLALPATAAQLTTAKPPQTKIINGHLMGWNSQTQAFDRDFGPVKAAGAGGAGGGSTIPGLVGDFNLTGEEFLKTIPAEYRGLVKKFASYEADPSRVASMRKAAKDKESERLKFVAWTSQYDPDYDASQVQQRIVARQELSRGTPNSRGGTISSLNRLARHLDAYKAASDEMERQGLSTHNTAIQNRMGLAVTPMVNQTAVTKYATASAGIVNEYNKLLSGGVPTDSERDALIRSMADPALPKANREAAMQTLAHFAEGQANAQEDWYTNTFGKPSTTAGHPLVPPTAGWNWDPHTGWQLTGWKAGAKPAAPAADKKTNASAAAAPPTKPKIKSITLVSE